MDLTSRVDTVGLNAKMTRKQVKYKEGQERVKPGTGQNDFRKNRQKNSDSVDIRDISS